ncbi:ATP-dependent protease, partial [Xylella fastidiosa subsp. multiplex]|nr:ATP-dependent protease [Xylella fastidiosa subsp. multiplex]
MPARGRHFQGSPRARLPPQVRQALEAAAIAALAGVPDARMGTPPFRAPHHSASAMALVGGGGRPRP